MEAGGREAGHNRKVFRGRPTGQGGGIRSPERDALVAPFQGSASPSSRFRCGVSVERAITVSDLRKVEAAYKAASKRHEEARAARNDLVRRAAEEGWSYEEIADALGLSRSRVGQIASHGSTPGSKRRGRRRLP